MKKPKIVSTSNFHPEIIKSDLVPNCNLVLVKTRSQLLKEIVDSDALLTLLKDDVSLSLIKRSPSLRVIGNFAVGINNIDLQACKTRNITLINTPDVLTRSTAELALGLLFSVARRFPEGDALCRGNRFKGWAPDLLLGLELKGRHSVILGHGRIGKETARLFKAVGLSVEFITRADSEKIIAEKLQRAQVLSLSVPLTEKTYHWLNKKRIKLLSQDCIVINTSRGPVIDEGALIDALTKNKIRGAGLDVFEFEPKIPAALRNLPNVTLLPHLGSATELARKKMAQLLISGVLSALSGKRPKNAVKL